MNKLSIGKHGIQVETHEKTNVMSSFNQLLWLIIPCLIILSYNQTCRLVGLSCLVAILILWGTIYSIHSFKNPELLQSETYRIEQHKIEAGMITNKDELIHIPEKLTTNITPLIETNNSEDIVE